MSCLSLLVLLQILLQLIQANGSSIPRSTLTGKPTNLLVRSNEVYVSTGRTIHIFNSTLSPLDMITCGNLSKISSIAYSSDSTLVYCFHDGTCYLHVDSNEVVDECASFVNGVAISGAKISLSSLWNYFYIASSGKFANNHKRSIEIYKLQLSEDYTFEVTPTFITDKIDKGHFISRDFAFTFHDDGYIYFIAIDYFTNSSENGVMIMRSCHHNDSFYNSMFEIKIDCGPIAYNSSIVSFSRRNDAIILGLSGPGNDKLCAFNVADVNARAMQIYKKCLDEENYAFFLPWSTAPFQCTQFNSYARSECDFGTANGMNSVTNLPSQNPVETRNLMSIDGDVQNMTATVLVEVDGLNYFYVALSGSPDVIIKYYMNSSELLIQLQVVYLSSPVLLMEGDQNTIYAATDSEIFAFEVDICSSYTNCSACTGSGDPMCGWCNLEGKCSRLGSCREGSLTGRWVQEDKMCLSGSFELESSHMSVDNLQPLKLLFGSEEIVFPELSHDDEYFCLCSSSRSMWRVPLIQSSTDVYCNLSSSETTTAINTAINAEERGMVVSVVVISDVAGYVTLTASNMISIHNCSYRQRCSDCELVPACGWCPYKNKCTGSSSLCYDYHNWITNPKQLSVTHCPQILPASNGRYLLPVALEDVVSLGTRNIPPPIGGMEYLCKLQYSNGKIVYTPTIYKSSSNTSQLQCQFERNQIVLSESSKGKGVEMLRLSVWTNTSEGFLHQIEQSRVSQHGSYQFDSHSEARAPTHPVPFMDSVPMATYDCSHFSESCSACTSINLGSGFNCVWCFGDHQRRCIPYQQCRSNTSNQFINSSTRCFEDPIITSLFPSSGPINGGTRVTITGIDLGVRYDEIEVRIGDFNCAVDPLQYIPAKQLVCTTSPSNRVGLFRIIVTVKRDVSTQFHHNATFEEGVSFEFLYANPSMRSLFPPSGPMSGGTYIVLGGSSLNISNTSLTTVRLAGHDCIVRKVLYSEIHCISTPVDSTNGGYVQLTIDGSIQYGHFYTYTEDPQYYSVQPQFTIPAGGVSLTFTGHYLNASLHPELVISIGNNSYRNSCISVGGNLLKCTSPRLPAYFDMMDMMNQRRNDGIPLNYTLVLDGAPGPNISNESLTLILKSNPVFLEIDKNDLEYEVFSGKNISLLGRNLDSVLVGEITVTLLGEMCIINYVTSVELNCRPPDLPILRDREVEVKVSMANGFLEYSVGSVRYLKMPVIEDTPTSQEKLLPMVVLGCVVVIAVAIVLLCFMGIICIVCIKKRNRAVMISNEVNDEGDAKFHMQVTSSHEFGENLYEVIPDFLQSGSCHVMPQKGTEKTSSCTNMSLVSTHVLQGSNGTSNGVAINTSNSRHTLCGIENGHCVAEQAQASNTEYNPCDEYVKMCSHCVSGSINVPQDITTPQTIPSSQDINAPQIMITSQDQNNVVLERRKTALSASSIDHDYVHMLPADQTLKQPGVQNGTVTGHIDQPSSCSDGLETSA